MSSKLINDLTHVPNIIAGLGLGVAQAQRHFDLEYLEGLERTMAMAQSLLGGLEKGADGKPAAVTDEARLASIDKFRAFVMDFVRAVAPARHQFTETTLTVKLDLAQGLDVAGSVGLSAGMGAVAVNAALSIGYSYDYRAAAECKTVIHANPPDPAALQTLLDRAKEINDKSLTLPDRSPLDQAVQTQAEKVFEKLTGVAPPPVTDAKKP